MKRAVWGALVVGALIWGGSVVGAQAVKVNPIADLDPDFIKGVDVSSLLAVEKAGGKFFDVNGKLIGQSAIGTNGSARLDRNDIGHRAAIVRAE